MRAGGGLLWLPLRATFILLLACSSRIQPTVPSSSKHALVKCHDMPRAVPRPSSANLRRSNSGIFRAVRTVALEHSKQIIYDCKRIRFIWLLDTSKDAGSQRHAGGRCSQARVQFAGAPALKCERCKRLRLVLNSACSMCLQARCGVGHCSHEPLQRQPCRSPHSVSRRCKPPFSTTRLERQTLVWQATLFCS